MNKYLIACFDSFEGINIIEEIEASSQIEAIRLYARRKGCSITQNESIDSIQDLFADADQYLSDPYKIS